MNNNLIRVIAQNFYGNRTVTEIKPENIDWFILGWTGNSGIEIGKKLGDDKKIAREVVKIPETNCVLVYNPIMEKEDKENLNKPVASIPEIGIEIYSRCFVCRLGNDGELESITNEDCDEIMKYLSK